MKNAMLLAAIFWLWTCSPSIAAQTLLPPGSDLKIGAESVGPLILGQKVKIMMRDASYLEGTVVRADRDEVLIRITKADLKGSSAVTQKGKEAFVRTSDIGTVFLRKGGSIAGPIALGVIGGILGAAGSVYLVRDADSPAAAISFLAAGSAGGATLGALIGREAVKKTITISVVPNIH